MNYVQVKFLESHSVCPKAYTHKNNCDLLVDDFAVVTVSGHMKLVRVQSVHDTNPSPFRDEDLKTVTGAVYLDPEITEAMAIATAQRLARQRLRELEEVAEAKRRLRGIRDELSSKQKAEFDEAQRVLGLS